MAARGEEGIRAFARAPRSPAKGCLRIRAVCNQVTKLKVTFLRNAVSLLRLGADRQFCGCSVNGQMRFSTAKYRTLKEVA